jgi:hypothetical protein
VSDSRHKKALVDLSASVRGSHSQSSSPGKKGKSRGRSSETEEEEDEEEDEEEESKEPLQASIVVSRKQCTLDRIVAILLHTVNP